MRSVDDNAPCTDRGRHVYEARLPELERMVPNSNGATPARTTMSWVLQLFDLTVEQEMGVGV
jgi:hypothetical protein